MTLLHPFYTRNGDDQESIRRLVRDLGDPDPLVRERAAEALSSVRPASEEFVRALIGALADSDPYVAGKASAALAALGPRSVEALAAALRSESADVRWGVVSALAKLGPDAGNAAPGLIEAVRDKDRTSAGRYNALGNMARAKAGVSALLEALEDGDAEIRWSASRAIAGIAPEAARGPSDWRPVASRIESLLPALMKECRVPGVSVALISNEGLAWSKSAGVQSADHPARDATRSSKL
jgi:HEAT repeat protein